MKQFIILLTTIACCTTAPADIILVDYDDGVVDGMHDASVRDGDFSVSTGNFDPWWDAGTGWQTQTTLASGVGSNRNIVMVDDRTMAVNTLYTLQAGDTFDASFMWRDASGWNDNANTFDFILYTTVDNTIGGTDFETVTFNSGLSTQDSTWETASASGLAFGDAGSVGKTVFARINTNSAANRFARVDNVYVEVFNVIPEPGTGLLALFGAGLLALRRRLS